MTSGFWTTRNQLAFGNSGCKDFRSIFDFHRFPQFQETVLAVDDLVQTWNNPPKLWKRTGEQPCVLQITGFASGPAGASVGGNSTLSRFEKLLDTIHAEFFLNESLRAPAGHTAGGITENAQLYVPRTPGFMNNHRDDVERKLFNPMDRVPPSPHRQIHKHEQMARELLGKFSTRQIEQELKDASRYDLDTLRDMLAFLGLNYNVKPEHLENPRDQDEIRGKRIEKLVFYSQDPRKGSIRVAFDDTAVDVDVYEGMPMHDFIHSALKALKECFKAKLEPLVKAAQRGGKRSFDLLVGDPVRYRSHTQLPSDVAPYVS